MPDAPPVEAAVDAAPVSEAVDDSSPSVAELVENETIDLASTGLPERTIAEIKQMRSQLKSQREVVTAWSEATAQWHPDDVQAIRQALAVGPDNPVVGQWFLEQARVLLGEEAIMSTMNPQSDQDDLDDDEGTFTAEQVRKIVEDAVSEKFGEREAKDAQQRAVEAVRLQTEELGFGPSHPLHEALISIARFRTDNDLPKAAELLKQHLREDNIPQPNTSAPLEAGGPAPQAAGHTPVPSEGGTPSGTRQVQDPRQAMRERLDKTLGSSRGFQDPQI